MEAENHIQTDEGGADRASRWSRLRRHPVFPVLVFVLASMVTGEFYPFSPFSMYSNPSTVPLRFFYVADGEGEALPILWHTGVSPASLTKKYNTHRGDLEEEIESGEREAMDDAAVRAESGDIVLRWLRNLSHKRRKRELRDPIQLVEVAVSVGDKGLVETERVVAELEAETQPETGTKAP